MSNRSALIAKTHKLLKKHYTVPAYKSDQPVLEAVLFACCLENAHQTAADEVFHTVRSSFFDWNEVRVSSVKELAEVMVRLPEPTSAATRLKGVLQSVFEADYTFDLEPLKKQNIGQAVKRLQKLDGATPFAVNFATQTALGGHSIPLDRGALDAAVILGLATESEIKHHAVPGLERAVPKSKGAEFAALFHELGADLVASPFSTTLRDLLLSIAPDGKDRLPKRTAKKPEPEPEPVKRKPAVAADPPRPVEAKGKKAEHAAAKPVNKHHDKHGAKKGEAPAAKKLDGAAKKKEPAAKKGQRPTKALASAKKKSHGEKPSARKPLAKRKPR